MKGNYITVFEKVDNLKKNPNIIRKLALINLIYFVRGAEKHLARAA